MNEILNIINKIKRNDDKIKQYIINNPPQPHTIKICEHNLKGKKCNNPTIDNSPFCKEHKCATKGCKRHRVGWELYKGKKDEYGIVHQDYHQLVPYCKHHRCDYVFGMGNPLSVKCNREKNVGHIH